MDTLTLAIHLSEIGGWADKLAVIDEKTNVRYRHRDIHTIAGCLADEFARCGVGEGDYVGFLVGDRQEWLPAFLALHRLGAIPLVVNPDLEWHVQSRMLAVLPTKLLLSYRDNALRLSDMSSMKSIHSWGNSVFTSFLAGGPYRSSGTSVASCYYLYSSGTTGDPKAVAHTTSDLAIFHEAVGGENGLSLKPDDRIVSLSQFYFTYGFNNQFVYPIFSGAAVVLNCDRRNEEAFVTCLLNYKATVAFSIPSALAKLADRIELTKVKRPATLRALVSAGEPLPDAIATRIEDIWQIPVLNQIGSTEVGNAFCANGIERRAAGTAGFVREGYRVELRPVDPSRVPMIESNGAKLGAIWVSGPTIPRRAVSAGGEIDILVNGWLETKDYGYWADNGGLVVAGRTDDFLHVGGISISAVEIEAVIKGFAGVDDCAVYAPLIGGVSTLCALVVVDDSIGDAEEFFARLGVELRGKLEPFRVPRKWTSVAAVPRTGSGKLMRCELPAVLGLGTGENK